MCTSNYKKITIFGLLQFFWFTGEYLNIYTDIFLDAKFLYSDREGKIWVNVMSYNEAKLVRYAAASLFLESEHTDK